MTMARLLALVAVLALAVSVAAVPVKVSIARCASCIYCSVLFLENVCSILGFLALLRCRANELAGEFTTCVHTQSY